MHQLCLYLHPIDKNEYVNASIDKNMWKLMNTSELHPGFSVDCVLICYHHKTLKVLLTKFKIAGYWSLPGGFMHKREDAQQAAERVLEQRTGLTNITLSQFHLFSNPTRTVIDENIKLAGENKVSEEAKQWLLQRFVSVGFYAFVKYRDVVLPKVEGEIVEWCDVNYLPRLYADHKNITETALRKIPLLLPLVKVAYELLPEKFTITEMRTVYELFLHREFDRRNFQRKMMSEGYIIQLDEKEASNAYNPAFLYAFDKDRVEDMDNRYRM